MDSEQNRQKSQWIYILVVMRERLSEEVMLSTVMKDMRECDLLASGVLLVIHSNYYFQCPQEDCKTLHMHTYTYTSMFTIFCDHSNAATLPNGCVLPMMYCLVMMMDLNGVNLSLSVVLVPVKKDIVDICEWLRLWWGANLWLWGLNSLFNWS